MEFSWGHSRFQGKVYVKAHQTIVSMTVFKKTYCSRLEIRGYKMKMKNMKKKEKKKNNGTMTE